MSPPTTAPCSCAGSRLETVAGTRHRGNCAVKRFSDSWREKKHNSMDNIIIKEEVKDTFDAEYSYNRISTEYRTPSAYSGSKSTTISTISVPPIQRVIPSIPSARGGLIAVSSGGFTHFNQNASDIFHREPRLISSPSGLKRSGAELDPNRSKHLRAQPPLISPPLVPTGPSYHQQNGNHHNGANTAQEGESQEDEWKNIKVVRRMIYFPTNV